MPLRAPTFNPYRRRAGTPASKPKLFERRRDSPTKRGYDGTWERLRVLKLMTDPLCECPDCMAGAKRVRPANVVHHIKEIATHPELRLEWDNLQSLFKRCHDSITAREHGFTHRSTHG